MPGLKTFFSFTKWGAVERQRRYHWLHIMLMDSLKTYKKLQINRKKKENLSLFLLFFSCSIFPQALTFLSRQKSSVILSSACFHSSRHIQAHTSICSLYSQTHFSWKIKQTSMTWWIVVLSVLLTAKNLWHGLPWIKISIRLQTVEIVCW